MDKESIKGQAFGEALSDDMLNEIAGAYESQTVGKRLRQGGSEEYLNG